MIARGRPQVSPTRYHKFHIHIRRGDSRIARLLIYTFSLRRGELRSSAKFVGTGALDSPPCVDVWNVTKAKAGIRTHVCANGRYKSDTHPAQTCTMARMRHVRGSDSVAGAKRGRRVLAHPSSSFWSRQRESNPQHQLGKLRFYH